ncbi:hypothetical protein CR513_39600, partial [Mucuna pruriens]
MDDLRSDQQHLCHPPVGTNNFELKPTLINIVQNSGEFRGQSTKELVAHLKKFLHFANTLKINNGVPTNTIRLRLFPFSLADSTLEWLTTFPDGAIIMWNECTHKFLINYFPPSKSNKLKEDIMNFSQFEQEPLD